FLWKGKLRQQPLTPHVSVFFCLLEKGQLLYLLFLQFLNFCDILPVRQLVQLKLMHKKNHTAHACENDILTIACPPRTSVAVLSAFYGPSQHLNYDTLTFIYFYTFMNLLSQKVRAKCQDRRSCHISVLSPVFGEWCPLTTKYLQVSYKCQPGRLVCENDRLRLLCKNSTVLAIYSATFGHLLHGSPNCPQEPGSHTDMECLSSTALRKVSRRCHGRENCSIVADVVNFGDPCFPGTRKHLRVLKRQLYTKISNFLLVPWFLLQGVERGSTDLFMISDYELLYCVIWPDYPEKVALYFVSGISAGLLCCRGLGAPGRVSHGKQVLGDGSDKERFL
uniref:Si:ch73-335m24.2 n=1 Tax=Neogobius melanostomus TaxID=47308 RepID=A0A8C6SM72_9GOBI